MRFQFNLFGWLFFVVLMIMLSPFGFNNESETETDTIENNSAEAGSAPPQNFNITGNNTNTSSSQSYNMTTGGNWRPPLQNKSSFKAGSTIPIKFNYTINNTFVEDNNVTVLIYDSGNNSVANFTVAKNPKQGIKIQAPTQYHVNWKTPKGETGNYTIIASFSDGFIMWKQITLF